MTSWLIHSLSALPVVSAVVSHTLELPGAGLRNVNELMDCLLEYLCSRVILIDVWMDIIKLIPCSRLSHARYDSRSGGTQQLVVRFGLGRRFQLPRGNSRSESSPSENV